MPCCVKKKLRNLYFFNLGYADTIAASHYKNVPERERKGLKFGKSKNPLHIFLFENKGMAVKNITRILQRLHSMQGLDNK